MKIIAVIQARLGSKRLPGKMLKTVGEWSLIEHAVRFANKLPVSEVVLATPDDALAQYAGGDAHVIIGDELCVSSRFLAAATKFGATHVVRICADSPFLDVELATQLIAHARAMPVKGIAAHKTDLGMPVIMTTYGLFVEVVGIGALWHQARLSLAQHICEHVTPRLYREDDWFAPPIPSEIEEVQFKCAVDTEEDLERVRAMYQALGGELGYRRIVRLVKERPEFQTDEKYQRYDWLDIPDRRVRAEP